MPPLTVNSSNRVNADRRTALVFHAHFFDQDIVQRLQRMLDETRSQAWRIDVHVLVESETEVPEQFENIATRFNFDDYRRGFSQLIGDRVVPGNSHLAWLFFGERHAGYEFYWFVEYDVLYTGDWGRFLARFADDESDLLAAHVREITARSTWYWANHLHSSEFNLKQIRRVAAFFPVTRLSKAALSTIHAACVSGWWGHFEILVPTLVDVNGLKISDIGGCGDWTPRNRRNRHYLALADRHDMVGTFRHRPAISKPRLAGMLYHPCKKLPDKWEGFPIKDAFRTTPIKTMIYFSHYLRAWIMGVVQKSFH